MVKQAIRSRNGTAKPLDTQEYYMQKKRRDAATGLRGLLLELLHGVSVFEEVPLSSE